MPTLTIRNIDARTTERLKEKARQHNRSLQAELRDIVEQAAVRLTSEAFFVGARRIREHVRSMPGADGARLQRATRDEMADRDESWM